jgi:hypothetical protein
MSGSIGTWQQGNPLRGHAVSPDMGAWRTILRGARGKSQ